MRSTEKRILALAVLAGAGLATFAIASVDPILPELVYPEGAAIPRELTPQEAAHVAANPITTPRAVTPPPIGAVRAVAEYEPMEGIILAYEGTNGMKAILHQMAMNITTIGNAKVFVYCDSTSEANIAAFDMQLAGADPSKIVTLVNRTDTIWCRDYGPRYIYNGDVRAIIDHTYNRPRPNDNAMPTHFAQFMGHTRYELPLVHGGGNYHLTESAPAWSTALIANENPAMTDAEISDIWADYEGTSTVIVDAFPTTVDATQHLDMWSLVISDTTVIVSDFPLAPGSVQDQICDNQTQTLIDEGYTVHRVPAIGNPFQTHYTFSNSVIVNDLVMIPYYDGVAQTYNDQALAVYQAAMPDHTIVQIDSDAIVGYSGIIHCICMHVPVNKNGVNPGAHLLGANGGETFNPNDLVEITWLSDDDIGVINVDILLSVDGGANFDTVIASAIADDGAFTWTAPDLYSDQARIRIVARDAQGNTGFDDSDTNFTINGAVACPADLNGDGIVDTADLGLLLAAFGTSTPNADINGDGVVDTADLGLLLGVFGSGCP